MITLACIVCEKPLSADEAEQHGFLCGACEVAHDARLDAWLDGKTGAEIDVQRVH